MNGTADAQSRGMLTVLYRLENQPSTSFRRSSGRMRLALLPASPAAACGYPKGIPALEVAAAMLFGASVGERLALLLASPCKSWTRRAMLLKPRYCENVKLSKPAVRFSFACQRRFSTVKWKTEEKGKEKEGNSMPIGVIVNCISVLAGGVIGSASTSSLSEQPEEPEPALTAA